MDVLGPFVGLGTVCIGGLIMLERRLTKLQEGKMDLKDHQVICEAHNIVIDKKLDELKELVKENHDAVDKKHEQNRVFQHDMRNELHKVALRLERIMATGQPRAKAPAEDTE